MKKILGLLFSALLIAATLGTVDTAQARNGRNTAAALGLLGGVAVGAAIANSDRHDRYYDCRAYGDCRGGRYVEPRRGLVYNDEKDCWVRRNNYWGPCRAY